MTLWQDHDFKTGSRALQHQLLDLAPPLGASLALFGVVRWRRWRWPSLPLASQRPAAGLHKECRRER
eukprot:546792-Pleurochrysis_carterae.AAC.1